MGNWLFSIVVHVGTVLKLIQFRRSPSLNLHLSHSLFLTAAFVFFPINTALAAKHVDVAPISDEVIQKLVHDRLAASRDLLPERLRQHLDEAATLLKKAEALSDKRALQAKYMMLDGKVHELEILREELRQKLAERRKRLEATANDKELLLWTRIFSQIEQRFDKVIHALAHAVKVKDHKHERYVGIEKARVVLKQYGYLNETSDERRTGWKPRKKLFSGQKGKFELPVHRPSNRVEPITTPIETFRMDTPVHGEDKTKEAPPPAYLSTLDRQFGNMYAAVGDYGFPSAIPSEASDCNFNAEDLAENIEIQLTQEIRDLAHELQFSPAQIFAYVSNNIKFEPYYGSLKGAVGTLVSGSGNATDQASLTIALLRASNIPARYVRGRIRFVNDQIQKLLDWTGAKGADGAVAILQQGKISANKYINDTGTWTSVSLSHVWLEACVPYGNYRGVAFDNTGHRWIPLDPSFKNKTYQDGIAIDVSFDYASYMSMRSSELPNEYYESQVNDYIKLQPPRFSNNTLDDVAYAGKIVPQKIDILPASLPYEVASYKEWDNGLGAEVATLPASHRYTFKIEISRRVNGVTIPKGTLSLVMPATVLNRITLSSTDVPGSQATYDAALNLLKSRIEQKYGTLALQSIGGFSCSWASTPVMKLEGVPQIMNGVAPSSALCYFWATDSNNAVTGIFLLDAYNNIIEFTDDAFYPKNKLKLTIFIGEGTSGERRVNSVTYQNILSSEIHALQAYAFQASDRLLKERASKLLKNTQSDINEYRDYYIDIRGYKDYSLMSPSGDDTLGEFLHLVGLKYMRYITDSNFRIGELNGESGESGNHIGLTSSRYNSSILFDLPYAIKSTGLLIDVPGGLSRSRNLTTGQVNRDTFLLSGYAASAYESYVWQENARMDAVSSVRGIQFANENGIEVLTLNSSSPNLEAELGKLTSNANAALNYSSKTVNSIRKLVVTDGNEVIIPRSLIQYDNWKGQVYISNSLTKLSTTYAIGQNAGGYTVAPPVNTWYNPSQSINTGWEIPTFYQDPFTTAAPPILSSAINFGSNQYSTIGGDPVNMVTGNMYHTETDIEIKSRGLPFVFERTYNSMAANRADASDLPMGYGWTHSFNHFLEFNDDNFDNVDTSADSDGITSSVTWVDGTGARKFIRVAGNSGGVPNGAAFTAPEGFYFQTNRVANGQYTLREKNGTTYTFENVSGTTGQKAKLLSISDRNGNSLTLTYNANQLDRVTDDLGRYLQFSYYSFNNRISTIEDWTGRRWRYAYDFDNGDLVSFFNPLSTYSNNVTYTYYTSTDGDNLNHLMRNFTLPRGNGMTFEYYMNGKVFRHYNSQNEEITFTYNAFRREATTVNERGFVNKYFFDEKGNPTKVIEQGGGERTYAYDPANPMNRISQTDPMGYVTSYQYDDRGNVTKTTGPSGSTVEYSYFNEFNQPGKIKDANGYTTIYKYDAKGNRTDVIKHKTLIAGSSANPAVYVPDPASVISWGVTTYDSYGNPGVIKQARDFATQAGPTIEFDYNDATNSVIGLNATTLTRCGDRDGNGNIERVTECQSDFLGYDALGRLTSGVGANGYPLQYEYDAVDRVVRSTDAVGNLRDYMFDDNGNTVGQKLLLGNGVQTLLDQTLNRYDMSDRVDQTIDAGGGITRYQYDAAGNVVKLTNPDGYTLGMEYDANNQVIKAFNEEGNSVSRELDITGRVRSTTDANGNRTTYEYYGPEKDGRLKRQFDALGRYAEFDYDANGNVQTVREYESGGAVYRETFSQYDSLNRPVRILGPVTSDPVLGQIRPVTKYDYDTLGNLVRVLAGYKLANGSYYEPADVLANQATSRYDDFGRKLTQTDALGKLWRYRYDRYGNLTQITDPRGQIVDRTYLYGGQLDIQTVSRSLGDPAPHITDYNYNALGQVTEVISPEVTYSYSYDAAHQLSAITDSRSGKRIEYQYSPGGMLDTMLDGEGNQTDYLYDPVGRLTSIWAANGDLVDFVRDAGGRLTEKWFSNGVNTRYSYNTDNSLAQIVNRAGSDNLISQHDYSYDGFGNRNSYREYIANSPRNYSYNYDELNRLTQVLDSDNGDSLIEGYSYDQWDNRRTLTAADGSVRAYLYDGAQQLKEIRQNNETGPILTRFVYDDNGNLTSKTESGTTLTLSYDALDRMVLATKTGLPAETYAYDPSGRRIEKKVGGAISRYRYAGPDIIAEYGADWSEASLIYTHGPQWDDPLIRATSAGMAQYYHQDGLGSVVSMTDMVGATTATARYDVWGNTLSRTGNSARYGYTGREPDATGLMYYRARYYDPSVGRFTQRDPKGFIDGINRYAYAINNPVNYNDPRGTSVFNNSLTSTITASSSYYSSSIPASITSGGFTNKISSANQSLSSNAYTDESDIRFTYGLQGGARIGLTKLLGAKLDLDFGSREISLATGKEYVNQNFAIGLDVAGFSFGFDASRNVQIDKFVRGKDSISNILSDREFKFKPVFQTPWSVSSKEFWKVDFGVSALLGIEGTLDFGVLDPERKSE